MKLEDKKFNFDNWRKQRYRQGHLLNWHLMGLTLPLHTTKTRLMPLKQPENRRTRQKGTML